MESKRSISPPYNSSINVHSRKRKRAYTASTTLYNKKKSKIGGTVDVVEQRRNPCYCYHGYPPNGCCSILLSIIFVLSIMLRETIDVDTVGLLLLLTSEQ